MKKHNKSPIKQDVKFEITEPYKQNVQQNGLSRIWKQGRNIELTVVQPLDKCLHQLMYELQKQSFAAE